MLVKKLPEYVIVFVIIIITITVIILLIMKFGRLLRFLRFKRIIASSDLILYELPRLSPASSLDPIQESSLQFISVKF